MPVDLPIPEDGESQADFAVRWHEATADTYPDPEERSRYCFRQWRDVRGEDPETLICRERFPSGEYDERRDIAIFDEHNTNRERYQRTDLVAIMNNQNTRIRQNKICAPLSDGHTSDNPRDPQPEVLGYCGPLRLGQIAGLDGSPKWALYQDEYHMKDKAPALKARLGRSIEMWRVDANGKPLPINKRYFYPIAALGSEQPRLDLPAARYSRYQGAEEGDFVRYAMCGGSNTFTPNDQGGFMKYGDQQGMGDVPLTDDLKQVVQAVLQAITQSDVWQHAQAMAEQQASMGSPSPAIPKELPPLMSSQPGQGTPGAGAMAGAAPGPFGAPDAFGANQPANQPQGGKPMSEQDKSQYSASASALEALNAVKAENEILKQAVTDLTAKIEAERTHRIQYARRNELQTLANEYELDVEKELTRAGIASDEVWADRVATIKECYRRRPETARDFSAVAGVGTPKMPEGELGREDIDAVVKYARVNGVSFDAALDVFKANKK